MARTLFEVVEAARARLLAAGLKVDEARLDAELLARHALQWDRARFIAYRRTPLNGKVAADIERLVERRARREPLAYIVGHKEFWGLDFEVGPDVLVPRPETEGILEAVQALAGEGWSPARIADVGTGSGCLAVSLARMFPDARIVATDVSSGALAVARRNALRHGVTDRIEFVVADLLLGIEGKFNLIVSNPPYVPAGDRPSLQPEVRDYEPAIALFAGEDGLDVITRLLAETPAALEPGGWLVFECGAGQAERIVETIGYSTAWLTHVVHEDPAAHPRVVRVRCR